MTLMPSVPNWLHLDFKGTMPNADHLKEWLTYFADAGFNGIVFEYEDRLPWKAWPGTYRPGFELEQWQGIWKHCSDLKLEIVPLIQVQGHLDWLLKHDAYAYMREAGHMSELCPQTPGILDTFIKWIDEVIDAHPTLRYMHLGSDETWHLASCPSCKAKADESPEGKLSVYLDHVAALCEHVSSRGLKPMIWGDMFWREKRLDLASRLPEDVILMDWHYQTAGPWPSTTQLASTDRELWGASGVCCRFDFRMCQAPLASRIENVVGWRHLRDTGVVSGVVHTTWGRSTSLRPIYGPWEGWLPAFIAAGNPERWESHPLREAMEIMDRGMDVNDKTHVASSRQALESIRMDDPLHQRVLDWWKLSLDHRSAMEGTIQCSYLMQCYLQATPYIGLDNSMPVRFGSRRDELHEEVDAWEKKARAFLHDAGWSDIDEYIASRAGMLKWHLHNDAKQEAAVMSGQLDLTATP